MRKYIIDTIMVLGSLVFIIGMFLPINSFAGNPGNSSGSGNATVIVQCAIDDDVWFVDHAQVAFNSDDCTCVLDDPGPCEGESVACTECLAFAQVSGCSMIASNGYFDTDDNDEKSYYTLSCNAGPLLSRIGGCPCP